MDDTQEKIKLNFTENLKAEEYLAEITTNWKDAPEIFRFMLVSIHDIFRSERFKGSKVLEIGSGATVHGIAAASAYFTNIVMSDFVEDNTENLKRWLRGESHLRQLLDIPAGLEGYGDDLEAGRKMLEARIRKVVKQVSRCDALVDGILLDTDATPETAPPFDVVISFLCLGAAPKDIDEFYRILKRVNALLRPGGGLIICEFFQGSPSWKVGEKMFHCIQYGEQELLDGLKKAGFGKIDLKTLGNEVDEDFYYKFGRMFCVAAEKL